MLVSYTCLNDEASCWIDPFVIIYYPFLSFITVFVLMSVLSTMSIAVPAFFSFILVWNVFSHLLTFSLYVSFSDLCLLNI